MISGFNPVVWNPNPPIFVPVYSPPLPMDMWSPAPARPDFLYGNMFFQTPPSMTVPLPFAPSPWPFQLPAYPSMTYQTVTSTPFFSQGAAPISFSSAFPTSATTQSSSSSMSLEQKKALLAERETAFRDNQKNWSKSFSSWGSSIMQGIEERRKAEKEGRA
jgi:hypothetical protein